MSETTVWWVLAGLAVVMELMTGTFYLLMFALGLVGGAVSAHLGLPLSSQLVVAAVVGGGAAALWHLVQRKRHRLDPTGRNRDVNLDVGEFIHVQAWSPDGTAQVRYRGALWTAVHPPGALPAVGHHRIIELRGNQLVVEKIEP